MIEEKKIRLKNAVFNYKNKEYRNKDLILTFTDLDIEMSAADFLGDYMNEDIGMLIPKQLYFGSAEECTILSKTIIDNIRTKKGIKHNYKNIKIECFL